MNAYQKFVAAAEFEDNQLGLGADLSIADVADRARVTPEEAQKHVDRMVREKLAERINRPPGRLKLDYDAIRFAREQGNLR